MTNWLKETSSTIDLKATSEYFNQYGKEESW